MSAVTLDADKLIDVSTVLGEGPAWDAARGVLSWVDVMPGHVHVCSAAGEFLRTYELGRAVGAAMPDGGGGFLLADAHGFSTLAEDGTSELLVPVLVDVPNLQFNDGKCDPAGRAFAGSMALDETPHSGTLYRLDAGPAATPVLGELTVSNGLGWSPDRRTMWFADSAKPQVTGFAYDLDTGELGEVRTVIAVEDTPGVPDGLCVDDDGCVWLALWDGESVRRYTPDGRLDTVVRVGAKEVTSCTFGGPDLSTLFITTAKGGLFAVASGTTGPAATPWRNPLKETNGNGRAN
jgi:sugar lactone lactonase YvrE